jgi:hypothetical protein
MVTRGRLSLHLHPRCPIPMSTCFHIQDVCRLATLAICLFLANGCANSRIDQARNAFFIDGNPQAAVEILEEDDGAGLSTLLFHMEKGLLLNQAGRFEESIAELREASDLMKKQDYLSISQQTASILVNEWMTEYKGEYCERLWIHTYLMIDYLMVDRYEDALVEAKQALKIFDAYPEALSEAYFSMALIGMCFESLDEFNDAYIVYKRLSGMMPDPEPVRESMSRMGHLSGIQDPAADDMQGTTADDDHPWVAHEPGEVVLFVGVGNVPVKVAGNIFIPPAIRFSFPRYENRGTVYGDVDLYDADNRLPVMQVTTDLGQVARASLGSRLKQIIIKETARVVTKEAIAQEVGKAHDAIVGMMTRLALMAAEEPDTRCWHTLPASNSLLRLSLEPGVYHLSVKIGGSGINGPINLPRVIIREGQRVFFVVRANENFVSIHGQEPVGGDNAGALIVD